MSSQSHKFNVGDYKCIAVSDGTFTYVDPFFPPPASFLFANAPGGPLEQILHKHGLDSKKWTEWVCPYICLIVNTGKHMVLIDTGAGNTGPDTGKLRQNLKSEGIMPGDIDTVILTHGHSDHIAGNTDSAGKPAFPNAQYVMWKDEWDLWNSDERVLQMPEYSRAFFVRRARKYLTPVQNQIRLVENEAEILPGVKPIPAPGHTPGHMAVMISSRGEKLLSLGDIALHPVHLECIEWCTPVDFDTAQVVQSRQRIFTAASDRKSIGDGFSFPISRVRTY